MLPSTKEPPFFMKDQMKGEGLDLGMASVASVARKFKCISSKNDFIPPCVMPKPSMPFRELVLPNLHAHWPPWLCCFNSLGEIWGRCSYLHEQLSQFFVPLCHRHRASSQKKIRNIPVQASLSQILAAHQCSEEQRILGSWVVSYMYLKNSGITF